jgi:signal transduction histidine kinase
LLLKTIFYNLIIFEAEKDAIRISTALRDSEIFSFLRLKDDEEDVYIPEETISEMDRQRRKYLSPYDILKIKIYNTEKRIVYSTDTTITGKYDRDNIRLKEALKGKTTSKYESKKQIQDIKEEERFDVGVVESYVPIRGSAGEVIGSFGVYKDVTEDIKAAKQKLIQAGAVLALTVLGVFEILILVIRHAGRVINLQTADLTNSNRQLKYEISRRKSAEETLRANNEELTEHNRLQNEFIITISHELRTPLAIFKNIISNLLAGIKGKLSDNQRGGLETADEEIGRLARVISDFLDVAKLETDKMDLHMERISINSTVDRVVNFYKPLAEVKNIEIVTLMPAEALYINADSTKIGQVMSNLIDNAVRFLPDCGGRITIRVKGLGNEVEVEVEDNGYGIGMEDISKVFDRFVQVTKQTGPGAHGTGLGLSICKELIELHGGRIWAENTLYGGAKFSFLLPKFSAEPVPVPTHR